MRMPKLKIDWKNQIDRLNFNKNQPLVCDVDGGILELD